MSSPTNPDPHANLLSATGQSWKVIAGIPFLLGGFVLTWWGFARAPASPLIILAGLNLLLGTIAAVWLSIKCPACGCRWMWKAAGELPASQSALAWRECPECHADLERLTQQALKRPPPAP
jgi:hypothetical protein